MSKVGLVPLVFCEAHVRAGIFKVACIATATKTKSSQDTPFDKYKDLTKVDWARFVEKCKSEHFGANSQYIQWL
jgi:hypothetical protein